MSTHSDESSQDEIKIDASDLMQENIRKLDTTIISNTKRDENLIVSNKIRSAINSQKSKMNYKLWEWLMIFVLLINILTNCLVKNYLDSKIQSAYNYNSKVILIGNFLRTVSYVAKESSKYLEYKFFNGNISYENYPNNTVVNVMLLTQLNNLMKRNLVAINDFITLERFSVTSNRTGKRKMN